MESSVVEAIAVFMLPAYSLLKYMSSLEVGTSSNILKFSSSFKTIISLSSFALFTYLV